MVSTHNSSILFQPLEVNQCNQTPLSMSDTDIGSLHQYPNPKDEQTIAEPMSLLKGSKVLKHSHIDYQIRPFIYDMSILNAKLVNH